MKKISVILFVLVIAALLFGLYKNQKDTSTDVAKETQKVTVLLDWFPNTNHTGLYVAEENGYYAEEGLDVEIIQPGQTDATQVVATGKANFGISSQEAVTLARAQDIPIISIAAVMQHNTSAFASRKDANITEVADFEGKRYGGWGSPIEEATLKALMSEVGADYTAVENVTIGTADFFTTIGRDSDFQWIFYGWDGVEAERRGIDLNLIWLADLDPVLDYYTPVIVTNEDHVTNQKDLTQGFLKATTRGYEFAMANPSEAAEILIKKAPELNGDLVRESQQWVSSEYTKDAEKWGIQEEQVWERYAQWLTEHGLMEETIDPQEAFTNEFLP